MQLTFRSVAEDRPGGKWRSLFELHWPAYRHWFLSEGIEERATYGETVHRLRQYMPELLPTYETLCELAGGGDIAARFLGLYRPPAYLTACSQVVWPDGPLLIRNYDYNPALCEGLILKSRWNEKTVLAMVDCLWGVLDGVNDSGLAISLTFGGRRVVGDGFGVPIVLRYILELCDTVKQAEKVLKRVPVHMAYNITDTLGIGFTQRHTVLRSTHFTRRDHFHRASDFLRATDTSNFGFNFFSDCHVLCLSDFANLPGLSCNKLIERGFKTSANIVVVIP